MKRNRIETRSREKWRFFCYLNWTNVLCVFILYSLSFFAAGKAAANEEQEPGAPVATVNVSLTGVDAELSKEVARLRREASRLEERAHELQRENLALREEQEQLRRELFESVTRISGQDEKLRRWQMGIAGFYGAEAAESSGDREARLSMALDEVSSSGIALAVEVAEFCREIDSSMTGWSMSQVQKAQLKLRLSALETKSRQFSALVDWNGAPGVLEKCRILAVNRVYGCVVLPVGTACGAFNGLVYHVTGKEDVRLMIVSVQPFVAAAMVVAGDIGTLSPGMEAVTEPKKNTEE